MDENLRSNPWWLIFDPIFIWGLIQIPRKLESCCSIRGAVEPQAFSGRPPEPLASEVDPPPAELGCVFLAARGQGATQLDLASGRERAIHVSEAWARRNRDPSLGIARGSSLGVVSLAHLAKGCWDFITFWSNEWVFRINPREVEHFEQGSRKQTRFATCGFQFWDSEPHQNVGFPCGFRRKGTCGFQDRTQKTNQNDEFPFGFRQKPSWLGIGTPSK